MCGGCTLSRKTWSPTSCKKWGNADVWNVELEMKIGLETGRNFMTQLDDKNMFLLEEEIY
jgi:hypothetical protein